MGKGGKERQRQDRHGERRQRGGGRDIDTESGWHASSSTHVQRMGVNIASVYSAPQCTEPTPFRILFLQSREVTSLFPFSSREGILVNLQTSSGKCLAPRRAPSKRSMEPILLWSR